MRVKCAQCRTQTTVSDLAAQAGGTFTCPTCHATNVLERAPASAEPAGYQPRSLESPPPVRQPSRLAPVLLGTVLGLPILTFVLPWVGVPVALVLAVWAIIALARPKRASPLGMVVGGSGHVMRIVAAIVDLSIAATAIGLGVFSLLAEAEVDRLEAEALAAAAEDRQREAAENSAAEEQLRMEATNAANELGALLTESDTSIQARDYAKAGAALKSIEDGTRPYRELDPPSQAITDLLAKTEEVRGKLDQISNAAASIPVANRLIKEGDAKAKRKQYIDAHKLYLDAADLLEVPVEYEKVVEPDLQNRRNKLRRKIERTAPKAEKQRGR